MLLARPRCPRCDEPARGSVEVLHGCAEFHEPDANGNTEYAGETDVWWDEQRPRLSPSGRFRLVCRLGHEWWSKVTE